MRTWQNLTDLFEDQDVCSEMLKKYRNTYLGIHTKTGVTYAKLKDYKDNSFHFVDSNGIHLKLNYVTDCEVFVPELDNGYYNIEGNVLFVKQLPWRQYRKGLHSDRYSAISIINNLQNKFNLENRLDNYVYDLLDYKQEYNSIAFCLMQADKQGGFAINKDYMVTLSLDLAKGYDLFYKTAKVGHISLSEITVLNPVFYQEILDTKHTWCPQHKIVMGAL